MAHSKLFQISTKICTCWAYQVWFQLTSFSKDLPDCIISGTFIAATPLLQSTLPKSTMNTWTPQIKRKPAALNQPTHVRTTPCPETYLNASTHLSQISLREKTQRGRSASSHRLFWQEVVLHQRDRRARMALIPKMRARGQTEKIWVHPPPTKGNTYSRARLPGSYPMRTLSSQTTWMRSSKSKLRSSS